MTKARGPIPRSLAKRAELDILWQLFSVFILAEGIVTVQADAFPIGEAVESDSAYSILIKWIIGLVMSVPMTRCWLSNWSSVFCHGIIVIIISVQVAFQVLHRCSARSGRGAVSYSSAVKRTLGCILPAPCRRRRRSRYREHQYGTRHSRSGVRHRWDGKVLVVLYVLGLITSSVQWRSSGDGDMHDGIPSDVSGVGVALGRDHTVQMHSVAEAMSDGGWQCGNRRCWERFRGGTAARQSVAEGRLRWDGRSSQLSHHGADARCQGGWCSGSGRVCVLPDGNSSDGIHALDRSVLGGWCGAECRRTGRDVARGRTVQACSGGGATVGDGWRCEFRRYREQIRCDAVARLREVAGHVRWDGRLSQLPHHYSDALDQSGWSAGNGRVCAPPEDSSYSSVPDISWNANGGRPGCSKFQPRVPVVNSAGVPAGDKAGKVGRGYGTEKNCSGARRTGEALMRNCSVQMHPSADATAGGGWRDGSRRCRNQVRCSAEALSSRNEKHERAVNNSVSALDGRSSRCDLCAGGAHVSWRALLENCTVGPWRHPCWYRNAVVVGGGGGRPKWHDERGKGGLNVCCFLSWLAMVVHRRGEDSGIAGMRLNGGCPTVLGWTIVLDDGGKFRSLFSGRFSGDANVTRPGTVLTWRMVTAGRVIARARYSYPRGRVGRALSGLHVIAASTIGSRVDCCTGVEEWTGTAAQRGGGLIRCAPLRGVVLLSSAKPGCGQAKDLITIHRRRHCHDNADELDGGHRHRDLRDRRDDRHQYDYDMGRMTCFRPGVVPQSPHHSSPSVLPQHVHGHLLRDDSDEQRTGGGDGGEVSAQRRKARRRRWTTRGSDRRADGNGRRGHAQMVAGGYDRPPTDHDATPCDHAGWCCCGGGDGCCWVVLVTAMVRVDGDARGDGSGGGSGSGTWFLCDPRDPRLSSASPFPPSPLRARVERRCGHAGGEDEKVTGTQGRRRKRRHRNNTSTETAMHMIEEADVRRDQRVAQGVGALPVKAGSVEAPTTLTRIMKRIGNMSHSPYSNGCGGTNGCGPHLAAQGGPAPRTRHHDDGYISIYSVGSEGDIEDPECVVTEGAMNFPEVGFVSLCGVGLLDLRGGGGGGAPRSRSGPPAMSVSGGLGMTREGRRPGAGVSRWLDDDPSLMAAEADWVHARNQHGRMGAEVPGDCVDQDQAEGYGTTQGGMRCGRCGGELGPGHGHLCRCGLRLCGSCMSSGYRSCFLVDPKEVADATAASSSEPPRRLHLDHHIPWNVVQGGGDRRTISLYDSIPWPTASGGDAGGVPLRPEATAVLGTNGGRRVVVCQMCCHDIDVDDWPSHECSPDPAVLECLRECLAGGPHAIDHADDAPSEQPVEERDPLWWPEFEGAWVAPSLVQAARWSAGQAEAFEHVPAHRARGDGPQCLGCGLRLGDSGVQWRICRCRATYCVACALLPCYDCGALGTDVKENSADEEVTWTAAEASAVVASAGAPPSISPEEAASRRRKIQEDFRERRYSERKASRTVRTSQEKQGLRPQRPRSQRKGTVMLSVNVSGYGTLEKELKSGSKLVECDYLFVQEHKCSGDKHDAAVHWLRKHDWDVVCGHPYWKDKDWGGGVAILSRAEGGIRPLPEPGGICKGRLGLCIADVDGECVLGCLYGVSGAPTCQQLPLWKEAADILRSLGLPFILGGAIGSCARGTWKHQGYIVFLRPRYARQVVPPTSSRARNWTGTSCQSASWKGAGMRRRFMASPFLLMFPFVSSSTPSRAPRDLSEDSCDQDPFQ